MASRGKPRMVWRPVVRTPEQKAQQVLQGLPEYERAESKPYDETKTTWEDLSDPKEYTRLLLSPATHVRLPDGTLLFTIEYLADQTQEFLLQVLTTLNLTQLQTTLDVIIDLLWFFYTTQAPIIQSPESTAYLSGLNPENLLTLLGPRYYQNPGNSLYHAPLLFTALTGKINFQDRNLVDIRRGNFRMGVIYREGIPVEGKSEYPSNPIPELWQRSGNYGLAIYRVLLYLVGMEDPMGDYLTPHPDQWFQKGQVLPHPLLPQSPYDQILLYDFFHPQRDDPYSDRYFSLVPFILRYHRDIGVPQYLTSLEQAEKFLLPELSDIIGGYAVGDNVSELAKTLGMVFPPWVDTRGKETSYFFYNLIAYHQLVKEEALPPLRVNIWKDESDYPDTLLVETYRPENWTSRPNLLNVIKEIVKRQHPLIPYGLYYFRRFIMLPEGYLFREEEGTFVPTGEKMVQNEVLPVTLDEAYQILSYGYDSFGLIHQLVAERRAAGLPFDPSDWVFTPRPEDYKFPNDLGV